MELSDWFKGFENGIVELPEAQRETFFRECGKNCVQYGTLQIYKDLYEQVPLLCECSRQSIIYVLQPLWKDRTFQVTICESILRGSQHCKMRGLKQATLILLNLKRKYRME